MTARTPKPAARRSRPPATHAAASPPSIGSIPLAAGRKAHPALGLGLWGLGRWTPADEARTKATIGRAYERGFRWFDTAEVYGSGRSERILGDVLLRAAGGAPDPFVTTKVSWEHLRPAQVRASLINSLERLGRSSVDLYLIHAPDAKVPLAQTMPALEALWKEGRVGAIGVSNFGLEELEEASRHLTETRIVVNQVRYNLFDRDEADPVREYCRSHQILIEAYAPLARGLLHGRFLDGEKPTPMFKRFVQQQAESDPLPELLQRARALRDLALEAGVPLGSLALHWLERQGAAPVVGASRPEQVDGNLAAWFARPDPAVLDRADAIARGDRA
ncbi:MAG TPA: aldo/keto reductase [Thermoplasmata archaeon]|nr:aldo/keto reductase [Thermoplasmata archaeon]